MRSTVPHRDHDKVDFAAERADRQLGEMRPRNTRRTQGRLGLLPSLLIVNPLASHRSYGSRLGCASSGCFPWSPDNPS